MNIFSGLKKGALHEDLGVPLSQKIPVAKVRKASKSSSPLLRKRAQFALNARKFAKPKPMNTAKEAAPSMAKYV